jgi:8-oxo-dGTP diphosphatase
MNQDRKLKNVVTGFLINDCKVLILKRSDKVGSYREKWAGISGYVEDGKTPFEQVMTEIEEETGLSKDDIKLIKQGKPIIVEDPAMANDWRIYPFLFGCDDRNKLNIDWEHTESRWIEPDEIVDYETVPSLYEVLKALI